MDRSTAGPMDWQYEQQPLRKRPHYDPSLESSAFLSRPHHQPLFSPSAGHQPLVGSSPAFLFHTPDHPRPPPLSPNNGGSFTFDPTAFNPVTAFGIPEVEMDLGGAPHPSNSSTDNAAPAEDTLDGQPDEGGAADASLVQGVQSAAATARKLAGGAVKRVLRQRQSASNRRGGSRAYVEGNDDHDASEGNSADSASDDDYDNRRRRPSSRRSNQGSSSALARRSTGRRNQHQPSETHYNLHLPGVNQKVAHGDVPYILLGYLQFFFNLSLVLIMLYLAVQFILTVKADISRKVEEASFDIVQEIASCSASYLANHCEPSKRVPAMHQACTTWEYCMNRDPLAIGRAQVGAETFAGVVNSFVDPISWKTMGFTLVTLSFLTILTNSALSFYRSSHRPTHAPPSHVQSQQHYLPPPPPHYAGLPRSDRGDPYAYGGGAWGAAGPSAAVGALGAGEQSGAVDLREEKKGWFS